MNRTTRRGVALPPPRGWPGPAAGRSPRGEPVKTYLGTTTQTAGLFPFMHTGGLPARGVPIGPDLLTHELVCIDPAGWVGELTSNPSLWVQGQPGAGKSTIVKRLCLGMVGLGYSLLVAGDVKGEYSPLVRALGGQVVRVGRGLDRINPLDPGPLARASAGRGAGERERIAAEIDGRRAELLQALASTAHGLGRRPRAEEAAALSAAVRLAASAAVQPVIGDVIAVLRQVPAELQQRLLYDDQTACRHALRELIAALENLCDGPLQGIFDGPTTRPLDLSAPAVTVDLSAVLTTGDQVVTAALLATWAYSYQAVDTARALGLDPRPRILPLDELWRVLRAGPGMVEAADSLTRLNRAKGEVTIMITHSLRDLDALPTEQDRARAAGLMERCDTVILAAQSVGELRRVDAQKPLTDAEIDLVSSWASPVTTGIDGTAHTHPGRGRYLIKIGQRIGIPVRLVLTDMERDLVDTDAAIRRGDRHGRQ
ncbi:MAG: hypothetical protein L0Y54_10300 [Sporichthyaceae bacterium]|nr:hypothetical protein [Sporichthyaceae bacterium]